MSGTLIQIHGLLTELPPRKAAAPSHDLVTAGSFIAVTSPWTMPSGVNDLPPDEVAQMALTHHGILQAYCADCALLPLRFGTVFSSIDCLQKTLATHAPRYEDALYRLSTIREYSVQLLPRDLPPLTATNAETGRDFLSQRQDARNDRRNLSQRRRAFCEKLETRLCALSTCPPGIASPKAGRLLDMTLLLTHAHTSALQDLASRYSDDAQTLGLALRITGPWPAYSFDLDSLGQEERSHVT